MSFQQISETDLNKIQNLPGNKQCIDCGSDIPEWASVSFGVVFCLECSGVHRGLGTHIDFVRSLTMDSWSDEQLKLMSLSGGNDGFLQFLSRYGVDYSSCSKDDRRARITSCYISPPARLYKQVLQARLQGRPEPTELPKEEENSAQQGQEKKKRMRIEGFGSTPPQARRDAGGLGSTIQVATALLVLGAAALYILSQQRSVDALSARRLSTRQVQTFYDRIGSLLDVMAVVEDEPRQFALDQAAISTNSRVLEIGPGTGRTAAYIQKIYGPLESYTGIEMSAKMAKLCRKRLDDAQILQGDALNSRMWQNIFVEGPIDVILAFYVLDIWSDEDIRSFLRQSYDVLTSVPSPGQIVLVSIASPKRNGWARIVMNTWSLLYRVSPMLVGGCRPIGLTEYLGNKEWRITTNQMFSVAGYTSQVVLATPVSTSAASEAICD